MTPKGGRFSWYPVTLERRWCEVPVTIAEVAEYHPDAPEGGALGEVWVFFPADTYYAFVETIQAQNDQQFVFTNAKGQQITLRQTRPDDAESWGAILPLRIDLPIEVIGALLQSTIPLPTLEAAVDAEGDVHTIILETNIGLYARYSGVWIRLADVTPIEQLSMFDIPGEDLETYDEADIAGNMVSIDDLHPTTPAVRQVIEATPEAPARGIGDEFGVRTVIVASIDDLPRAIEFATTAAGAGSRFYVERRCKAFGYPLENLPWAEMGR